MKINLKKESDAIYLYFGEHFIHTIFEWGQLFGKWNWYSFTFFKLYFENDKITNGFETEFIVLGIGIRLGLNFDENVV